MKKPFNINNLLKIWSVTAILVILLVLLAVMYFYQLLPTMANAITSEQLWILIFVVAAVSATILLIASTISKKINTSLLALSDGADGLSAEKISLDGFNVLENDFDKLKKEVENSNQALTDNKALLQSRENNFNIIINGLPEAVLTLTSTGEIASANTYASEVFSVDAVNLVGENIIRFFDSEHQINDVEDIIEQQKLGRDFKGVDYNGHPFFMRVSLNTVENGDEQYYLSVISDITALKQAENKLTTTSLELDTILQNAMVGIAFIKDRVLLRVNQKFAEIFAYDNDEIIGQSTRYLCPDNESFEQLGLEAYKQLEQGEPYEGLMQLSKKSNELFWCAISCKAISSERPQDGTIWLFEDVTQQHESDEKLKKLAQIDSLTGLPNRSVFNDRLNHAIHKAMRSDGRLAIFFMDLDHFKHINDSLGHKAGDQLLMEVAKRLQDCVRQEDTVARLGGDEFTVILEDILSVQFVAKVAEKVMSSILKPYKLDSTEVTISASVGVSLYPADGRNADSLIRNADAAMYHAKNSGRNNFQFYSSEMNAQAMHRLAMETELRKAIEQESFALNFQPQVDINTRQLLGAEVLLRWHSDKWGDVPPTEFIPILEDTGLIGVVGEMVIKEGCRAYMKLKEKLRSDFKIAINLSGRQFHGTPLSVFVKNTLEAESMSADNLELEITESILMKDTELAIRTLSELTKLGVTLAIDDFGTGYSSLSYLKKFPLNVLKIDKSFVNDVTRDPDDAAIIDAILAMSHHLQLDVVAEGIETKEQLEFLQKHHCQRGQGFYFSKPLNFTDFSILVESYLEPGIQMS